MDQGPLVIEQIDAGAQLARDFDQYAPLKAAFWLKESGDNQWYLYLVSDRINDTNFDLAYGEVLRLLGPGPHLWLDPFEVKVVGVDDPIARDVIDIQSRWPGRFNTRLRNRMLGGVNVEEAILYALPITAAA